MPTFTNFYENLKEAHLRLRNTVVLYDGNPVYIFAITDHKNDGIFRAYVKPLPIVQGSGPSIDMFGADNPGLGPHIDQWMIDNPNSPVLRKQMNSPLFNKFRPFPIGMVNQGTGVFYVERQPTRDTRQGLTRQALDETMISLGTGPNGPKARGLSSVDMWEKNFSDTLKGLYPSAEQCIDALMGNEYENEAVAFHRNFALIRGPIGMIFLAYKGDVIGVLTQSNFSQVRLGAGFAHTREVVASLGLFNNII